MTKPKNRGKTRGTTPAAPPKKLTTEQRLDRIAYLMIKGQWSRGRLPGLAKRWGVSVAMVAKLADRASVRVELAAGKLKTIVMQAHLDLDAIQREARANGQYTAAVRAVDLRLKLAGAYSEHRPGRGKRIPSGALTGLPPELAALSPSPSPEEVEHFASTRPEDCTVATCRVHGKAAPAPGAVH